MEFLGQEMKRRRNLGMQGMPENTEKRQEENTEKRQEENTEKRQEVQDGKECSKLM